MTIRRRIMLLSSAGAAVMGIAVLQFYRLSVVNSFLTAEGLRTAYVNDAAQRIDLLSYEYLLYGEPRARRQLQLQCQRLHTESLGFAASSNIHQQEIAIELHRAESLLIALDVQLQAPVGAAVPNSVRSRYLSEQLIISSHEMVNQARRWQAQMVVARDKLLREATLSALIASSTMLLLLTTGAMLLLRTIVRPVERLRHAVAAVAAGDLSQRVPVDRNDEIGVLSNGFNQMTQALVIAAHQRERTLELESRTASLERINHDLEHFSAMASHDLQAPLRTIGSFSELIQRRAGSKLDERSLSHLQRIIEATGRMRSLIDSLLRFARVGNVDVDQDTDIGCRVALDQAVENLNQVLVECGAAIDINPLPDTHFDGIHLIQVFQNLIGNAIKYRTHERDLKIRIWSQPGPDGYHALLVRDNGPGIDPQHHVQIFGMFQRAHGSEVAGSGIGLALCNKIIQNRGGTIHVESIPGQGATFIFTVPVATGAPKPPRPSRRLEASKK